MVSMSSDYPRDLTPDMRPFDPLELARTTQKQVCTGNKRKYTAIYAVGVYGGIVTAYAVGCSLRCIYCWVGPSREYPKLLLQSPVRPDMQLLYHRVVVNEVKKRKIIRPLKENAYRS